MMYRITILMFLIKVTQQSYVSKIYANKGQDVVLSCQNTPGNVVAQWLRRNSNTNESFYNTLTSGWTVYQKGMKILGDVGNDFYNLEIKNASIRDSGLYRCATEAGESANYTDVQLIVTGQDDLSLAEYSSPSNANSSFTITDISSSKHFFSYENTDVTERNFRTTSEVTQTSTALSDYFISSTKGMLIKVSGTGTIRFGLCNYKYLALSITVGVIISALGILAFMCVERRNYCVSLDYSTTNIDETQQKFHSISMMSGSVNDKTNIQESKSATYVDFSVQKDEIIFVSC